MTSSRRFSTLIPALAVAALLATPAFAQDKAKPAAAPEKAKAAAPAKAEGQEQVKVLLENDKVRVTETRYKPGAASAMRERNARVTRALVDGTMEKTYADGKKETIAYKAGDVKYFPKETFTNKNVGKKEMALYVVTLK
jgi:hypothetical protein